MVDKIKVIIVNRQKEVKIPKGIRMLVRRCCNSVLRCEKFKGSAEVSITFVDNLYIQSLNKQYRNIDAPTDVLSFSMAKEDGTYDINPANGAQILGDVVISMEKVVEQSTRYGHSMGRELAYLVAHGMFHILGYDHVDGGLQKRKMREKEEVVIASLGYQNAVSYISNDD